MKRKKSTAKKPKTQERRDFKNRVRKSPEWAELRQKKYEEQNGIDPITLRPLLRGYNVHHLSQEWTTYNNLESDRFVALNKTTHELVHFAYTIYRREKGWEFLDELKRIVELMEKYTDDDQREE